MQNHYPEHYPVYFFVLVIGSVKEKMLRIIIWHPLLKIWARLKKKSEIKPPLASVINVIYAHYWRIKVWSKNFKKTFKDESNLFSDWPWSLFVPFLVKMLLIGKRFVVSLSVTISFRQLSILTPMTSLTMSVNKWRYINFSSVSVSPIIFQI